MVKRAHLAEPDPSATLQPVGTLRTPNCEKPVRFPLTFQQEWLWMLLQRDPDWRCLVVNTFRLRGVLDVVLFENCFDEMVRRHSALQVTIVADDGTPQLRVVEHRTHRPQFVAIDGTSEPAARAWVQAFSSRKVDPLADPLLVAALLRLEPHEHWFVLGMHRLVGDCASIDQVFLETWLLYGELRRGSSPPLSAAVAQYTDYALKQRQTDTQWRSRHDEYWLKRLEGAPLLRWPADIGVVNDTSEIIGRMNARLGETVTIGLRNYARAARTLLANAVMGLYVALVWRWCGQRDFVLPVFLAGRQSEHRTAVGYFSHILYLRIQLAGRESFTELVSLVGQEFFRALSHQDYGRMAVRSAEYLAGTFFQWLTWRPQETEGWFLPVSEGQPAVMAERVGIADFAEDLTALPPGRVAVEITFFDSPKGIYASGVYRTDLFTAARMREYMAELALLAAKVVETPDVPLPDILPPTATGQPQTLGCV